MTAMNPLCLRFSMVESIGAFQSLGEQWCFLWKKLAYPHLFSSFDWCWNAWTMVAERRGYQLRIVCGHLDGRLVLVWPMMEDNHVLRMLSAETLEYRGIIVEPSEQASQWMEEAWSFLRANTRAKTFLFQNLRQPNLLATKLEQMPNVKPIGGGWCPLVRLDHFTGWEDYAATLPKSLVSDQRRQWKRLRQALPGISFKLVDSVDGIAPVLDWVGRHKVIWGDARGKSCIWFNAVDIHSLLKTVAEFTLADGRLVMATLSDGTTTVSAGWGYVCGSEFLFHAFAYDAAYATYSPSRLFLERVLQWCFDNGLGSLDFMPGDEAYKRTWATHYERTNSYVGPLLWRGQLLLYLSTLKRMGMPVVLEKLYHGLPSAWREAIRRRLRSYHLLKHALSLSPPQAPQHSEPAPRG